MTTDKETKYMELNLVRAVLFYLDSPNVDKKFRKKRDFILKVIAKYNLIKKDADGNDFFDLKYFPQELAFKIIESYIKDVTLLQPKQKDEEIETLIAEMNEIF